MITPVYIKDGSVLLVDGSVAIDAGCCCSDCLTCDNLPPTNPSGPPVHINIAMTYSGTCSNITYSGTVTYDADLGFALEGPIEGHEFCAHDIAGGPPWSGTFTATCTLDSSFVNFGGSGAAGVLLGRDTGDCTWWMVFPTFVNYPAPVGTCSLCVFSVTPVPFQMIAGAGDPSGVYVFSDTNNGVTLTITVTIT